MTSAFRPGDVLASRYRLVDLLVETGNGRFWRAHDVVLDRHVALHTIAADDARADALLEAARRSTAVVDRRLLRVLDASVTGEVCYVVHEWGAGISLDIMVGGGQVLDARQAAWTVGQVAQAVSRAHERGVSHGRLAPENVLVDRRGHVRVIGMCVDAALHGLPFDDPATDVTDLAGLLHCALTGTWAGTSRSGVRRAPSEHGRVLRPRRVRAGISRPLDAVCESTLNPRPGADPPTAAAIAEALRDVVGDDTGVPESLAAGLPPVRERFPLSLPAVPPLLPHPDTAAPDTAAPETASTADAGDDEATGTAPVRVTVPEDEPTQAALPSLSEETQAVGTPVVADRDDDTGSSGSGGRRSRRRTPGPPPPPPPEVPVRPLFAPDPPDGSPSRRPRVRPDRAGTGDDDTSTLAAVGGPASAAATGTASGAAAGSSSGEGGRSWPWEAEDAASAPVPPAGLGPAPALGEPVPGRRTLRLALLLGLLLALVVGAVVVYNLGRGRTVLGAEPSATPSTSAQATPSAAPATPLTGLVATDLDPQGEDGRENPDQAPLAVDGDDATAWSTVRYFQQLGPAGLKTGVGLSVDLGAERSVAGVDLAFEGAPTDATVFVSDDEPTTVAGLARLGRVADAGATASVSPDEPVTARYVVVWLTSLPTVTGGYAGGLREVVVLGG